MAENSKIEWTKHTVNLVWGCSEVHSGCTNCYAKALSHRYDSSQPLWGIDTPRRRILEAWKKLRLYQKKAKKAGEIHPVFIGSMMDIFEKPMPLLNPTTEWLTSGDLRKELFKQISAGNYPNLLFLFLTKRPSNINKYIPSSWREEPPSNVMFGTSVVDQPTFDTLVNHLLQVKGSIFLSLEPQLAHIQAPAHILKQIDWVIQGGESGAGKRTFDLAWARSMRDQCKKVGVPYFFKQIDKVKPIPDDLLIREFPFNTMITSM